MFGWNTRLRHFVLNRHISIKNVFVWYWRWRKLDLDVHMTFQICQKQPILQLNASFVLFMGLLLHMHVI